jgi:hypothetical protein
LRLRGVLLNGLNALRRWWTIFGIDKEPDAWRHRPASLRQSWLWIVYGRAGMSTKGLSVGGQCRGVAGNSSIPDGVAEPRVRSGCLVEGKPKRALPSSCRSSSGGGRAGCERGCSRSAFGVWHGTSPLFPNSLRQGEGTSASAAADDSGAEAAMCEFVEETPAGLLSNLGSTGLPRKAWRASRHQQVSVD